MTTQAVERKLKNLGIKYNKDAKGDLTAVFNGWDIKYRQYMNHVIQVKPITDESDPHSDYCAWSFLRRIKDLETL